MMLCQKIFLVFFFLLKKEPGTHPVLEISITKSMISNQTAGNIFLQSADDCVLWQDARTVFLSWHR